MLQTLEALGKSVVELRGEDLGSGQYDAPQANLTMYGYGAYKELKKDTLALGDDLGVDAIY